jgi:hypothetical protein
MELLTSWSQNKASSFDVADSTLRSKKHVNVLQHYVFYGRKFTRKKRKGLPLCFRNVEVREKILEHVWQRYLTL